MGLNPTYLVDKSASARMHHKAVAARLGPLREHGRLATCGISELELLYSVRSAEEYEELRAARLRAYAWVPVDEMTVDRALEVQRRLAQQSRRRAVKLPDLLIAAAAELNGLAVLHYDADFDVVAEVTGQATEWVVARGSV